MTGLPFLETPDGMISDYTPVTQSAGPVSARLRNIRRQAAGSGQHGVQVSMIGNKKSEPRQSREGWRFAKQIRPNLDCRVSESKMETGAPDIIVRRALKVYVTP